MSNKKIVIPSTVNPDLLRERQKCSFNVRELTYFLDGGQEKYMQRKDRETFFLSDPELKEKIPSEYLSHEDKYREYLRRAQVVMKKLQKLKIQDKDTYSTRKNLGFGLLTSIFKEGHPLGLHHAMFIPTLMSQADDEQKEIWLKKAMDMKIIGTYAQTELGHGTFLRGLETIATFIPERDEFEINSPTLSAYKWWPGGLGHSTNYAIVMAQLHSKGQNHGMHAFIVPTREEKTHKPMPGINIGEIGHKLGMNAVNNGFIGFNKVRIPRKNMLMKNAQILKDGTYVKLRKSNNRLGYLTMIYVRVYIVQDMSFYTAKAATIATRYSAVRHQSEMKPGEPEPQILDYQTQQYKIFPILATSYAIRFAAYWLNNIYTNVIAGIDNDNADQLPELHAIACCLKAVCTSDAANAIETARLSCGGHGYMSCSSFPVTYGLVTATCTYEGENTVMLLQTARALMKAWNMAQAGEKISPINSYLTSTDLTQPWTPTLDGLLHAFKCVAYSRVANCANRMKKFMSQGITPEHAWNRTSIELVKAAEAHCRAFIVEKNIEAIKYNMSELSNEIKLVLTQLCELYAVYWLLNNRGDFLTYTTLSTTDLSDVEDWLTKLLAELRPNAVGLVDAFDFADDILGSALGAWDGNVYERLLESAMKSPLNAKPVHDSFHSSLAPLLTSKY